MRFAKIENFEIRNGKGIGISLYTQGCRFHCKNCFNSELWDIFGGKEWTEEVEDKFISLASSSYLNRISILGGEPLIDENLDAIYHLIKRIKEIYPNKKVWLYSGYTYEELKNDPKRLKIVEMCDILVEGRYVDELRDLTLKFRGSSNQRIIDTKLKKDISEVI